MTWFEKWLILFGLGVGIFVVLLLIAGWAVARATTWAATAISQALRRRRDRRIGRHIDAARAAAGFARPLADGDTVVLDRYERELAPLSDFYIFKDDR